MRGQRYAALNGRTQGRACQESRLPRDEAGYTPLLKAIGNNHILVVEYMCRNGANMESEGYGGNSATPLLWAAQNGNIPVLKCLCDHGVNHGYIDAGTGMTILHLAALNSSTCVSTGLAGMRTGLT